MRPASCSASRDTVLSNQIGIDRPCRRAFLDARALPARERGPVLARAFSRLARRLRSLVILTPLSAALAHAAAVIDFGKFDVLHLLWRTLKGRIQILFVTLGHAIRLF